jgi:hypothetical protein
VAFLTIVIFKFSTLGHIFWGRKKLTRRSLFFQVSVKQKHWSLDATVQLKINARRFDWKPTESQPLSDKLIKEGKSTTVNLIPYGCTKFRVSMFPLTENSWNILPDINAGE